VTGVRTYEYVNEERAAEEASTVMEHATPTIHATPTVSETVEVGEAVREATDQMHHSNHADPMAMRTSQHPYAILMGKS
jgi:hypothetical protein